ncbi:hypothetical protein [Streptomyces mirabilis]|uniref:hypothetical protein n=1 Tax=Streptomyces mirabilis TaxID=68239 RepID=UPI0033246129
MLHLPAGRYYLTSSIDTLQDDGTRTMAVLYRPELVVDGSASLTLDARVAKPIDVRLPDREATTTAGSLMVQRNVGDDTVQSFWLGSLDTLSFAQLGGAPTTGSLHASINGLWARPEAWEGAATPQYHLAFALPDKANAGLTRRLTRKDLARIDSTISAPLANRRARVTAIPFLPDGTSNLGVAVNSPRAVPRMQTDYVNADASWSFLLTQFDPEGYSEAEYYSPQRSYRPGRTYRTGYGVGVFGPGEAAGGGPWGLFRTGDALDLTLSLQTDGLGHPGVAAQRDDVVTRTTLVADGATVFDRPVAPFVDNLQVPSGDARFTLTSSITQSPRRSEVSTRVDSTWTFRSATVASGTRRTPLLNIRYAPRLTADTSAPAAGRISVPVTVEGAGGGVRSLTVSVSYDEGESWARVLVKGGRILLHPVEGAESVSLRASAVDGHGNTAQQTIVRAFKLTPRG